MDTQLGKNIQARGRRLFQLIKDETPSVFDQGFWSGKVLAWAMANESFKVQLFRFIDVLPCLNTSQSLQRHIKEYFAGENHDLPAVLKWGAGKVPLVGDLAAKMIGKAIRANMEALARGFIIGRNIDQALESLSRLRAEDFAFTTDFMGEATLSEAEADQHLAGYLELLDALGEAQRHWPALGGTGDLDWGYAPKINLAVKPSAFYSQAKPAAPTDSVDGILSRLEPLYQRVVSLGGALCLDKEQFRYKEITLELFRRLRSAKQFRNHPHLQVALQAYLRDAERDLAELLAWARDQELPISVRLVKGAYWDYETAHALQCGWPPPVWTHKSQSDMAFERLAATILENHDICYFACASHNIRSIAAVLETADRLQVSPDRYEFQLLYGMAEPVGRALLEQSARVRLYCPYGEPLPGMSYLVRRLLENTANESFLRQSFAEGLEREKLLEDPQVTLRQSLAKGEQTPGRPPAESGDLPPFTNHPLLDFTALQVHREFPRAISRVRGAVGRTYPLLIGGREVKTRDTVVSQNPADPNEILGLVCQAGQEEIDQAVAEARKAFPAWRETPVRQRVDILLAAARLAREHIYDLASWQILEVGKQWDQAYNDVGEAIDFLEYYSREMLRMATPQRLGKKPGERNFLSYDPRGLAAVIAPWNFPLAISAGMCSAALVAGNCVIYKPSSLSSVVGWHLAWLFEKAGMPPGVFNFCPGSSAVMGDYLVEHPQVDIIAFTGSSEVGLGIQQKAASLYPGQRQVKRVIAEMGGKNAVIIDDDADLDEAVSGVLASAFGYQGQKCSACSRLIVLDQVYERFRERLLAAADSLKIGPAQDPVNFLGPVVDAAQQKKVLAYIELADREGKILLKKSVPQSGYYVPLTIVDGIRPEHRLAQEEVFGPLLAIMRAGDFDQALDMANSTSQALTGGVFSRSPGHLERAAREFRVGNLYLNRGITGSLVGRQPFGGRGLSGLGYKAGGPHYLQQFLDERCLSENTMRRGFTPVQADDEWV